MTAPNPRAADRNLLFGILALQVDFITRDQLIAAMHAWVLAKERPLGEVLRAQGALGSDELELLEAMVAKHVAKHNGDASRSLQTLSSISSVHTVLGAIADPDVQASLAEASVQSVSSVRTVLGAEADPDVQASPAEASVQDDAYATVVSQEASTFGTIVPQQEPAGRGGTRFRVLRKHARGGLGEVFVARDVELGREVALKEIQGQYAHDAGSRARFVLEAEITGGLEHPGIVPVYGLGSYADGRPFYAMRFIRGDSLKEAVEAYHSARTAGRDSGSQGLRHLLRRFYDVCNAIEYAHSRGVLHRDLKPANVMLGKYGETLVVDWGLAKPLGGKESPFVRGVGLDEVPLMPTSASVSAQTEIGRVIGTPAYMSPEQAAGRLDVLGPPADVYSLGATLYCILTGRPPFVDKDLETLLGKVQRGDFVRPRAVNPEVAPALEAICLKAMAVAPEGRYPSAAELAADIERWSDDLPVTAWPEPWAVRTARWIKKHRLLVTNVAAASFVALVGLTVLSVVLTTANERLAKANQAEQQQRLRAEAANEDLAKANQAEQQQRLRAEANYAKARKAVDEMLTRVGDKRLAEIPQMEEVRRELLEEALKFYEAFLHEQQDNRELRRETAHAFFRAGLLQFLLGRLPDAERAYEKALALRQRVYADEPRDASAQQDLALSHYYLGVLQRETGRQEAEGSLEAARALQEELVAAKGSGPADYRKELAQTLASLGSLYWAKATFQPQKAEEYYLRSLKQWQELHADSRDDPTIQKELAVVYNSVGIVQRMTGREEQAEVSFGQALKLQEPLLERSGRPVHRQEVARTCNNLGILLTGLRRFPEAEKMYQRTVELHERNAKDYPAMAAYQQDHAAAHTSLGVFYYSNQPTKAVQQFRLALEVSERLAQTAPGVLDYERDVARSHCYLGSALVRLWKYKEAEESLQQGRTRLEALVKEHQNVTSCQEELARCLNNLGQLWSSTKRVNEAEDAYQQARDQWQELVKAHPSVTIYRQELAQSQFNVGQVLRITKGHAEAVKSLREARQVREELMREFPKVHVYRQQLAFTLMTLGKVVSDGDAAEAEACYRQALALRLALAAESKLQDLRSEVAIAYQALAELLDHQGRVEEAHMAEYQANEWNKKRE